MSSLLACELRLPGHRRGKVRDLFDLSDDRVLIVASDRISAFDVVLPTPIPGKGELLTSLSALWFRFIEARGLSRTHFLSGDPAQIPDAAFGPGTTTPEALAGRSTIARRCRIVPVECVVRGYLEGSGWKEYREHSTICGLTLPDGLRQGDRLPEPLFTPATKAEQGQHDENIDFERACEIAGESVMNELRDRSLAIYAAASRHALDRGIIIADTKFEFGFDARSGELILADEALTPDSSRFWDAERYRPGGPQASFDKQFVREHLEALVSRGRWNKQAPGPALPPEIVQGTLERYREAVERLAS